MAKLTYWVIPSNISCTYSVRARTKRELIIKYNEIIAGGYDKDDFCLELLHKHTLEYSGGAYGLLTELLMEGFSDSHQR